MHKEQRNEKLSAAGEKDLQELLLPGFTEQKQLFSPWKNDETSENKYAVWSGHT